MNGQPTHLDHRSQGLWGSAGSGLLSGSQSWSLCPPCPARFRCFPASTHLIQHEPSSSASLEACQQPVHVESGVLEQGNISNVQGMGGHEPELRTTGVSNLMG